MKKPTSQRTQWQNIQKLKTNLWTALYRTANSCAKLRAVIDAAHLPLGAQDYENSIESKMESQLCQEQIQRTFVAGIQQKEVP